VGGARRGGEAGHAEPAGSDGARTGRWPGVGDFDDRVRPARQPLTNHQPVTNHQPEIHDNPHDGQAFRAVAGARRFQPAER